MSENDEAYICADCIKERGYRWPDDGGVEARKCRCSMCELFTICFCLEDLEPAMEVKRGLPKGMK
jgi:hypothetical protein